MKVRKRDGRVEPWEPGRVARCVSATAEALGVNGFDSAGIESLVLEELQRLGYSDENPADVETIQDVVVRKLAETNSRMAEAYEEYRRRHERLRKKRAELDIRELVESFVGLRDWRSAENANIVPSFSALMFHAAGAVNAKYLLSTVYPPEVADAHIDGDLHLHDLYMGGTLYCLGHSLLDLLTKGIVPLGSNPRSRPPKHLDVALQQIVNYIGIWTQESAGAQSFNSIDVWLAPFIREDGLSYQELKQLLQQFVYNLNVTSRWGGQSPFTNLTLSLGVPRDMRGMSAIVGGRPLGALEEYAEEVEMFDRAFLEVMLEGDADGRPFTFPIPTFALTKDFDWDGELSRLLFALAGKYGLPYFQNFVNSDLNPGDVRSMCCRLSLDLRELRRNVTGGLFGSADKTGSIGVVTINMPRIGYLSRGDEGEFFRRLDHMLLLASRALEHKREIIQQMMDRGMLPATREYLGTLDFHFSTVGLVGMHEACLNMGIEGGIVSEEGRRFSIRVLEHMRRRLAEFQQETGHLYNLEATPAEGTSYRLARLDRQRFPSIRASGEREPFYTNSTQLPVDCGLALPEALSHQEPLQRLYTGGTVFHVYAGEACPDAGAVAALLRRMCERWRIPYYSFTPTYSVCPDHGYMSGNHPVCPYCGREAEVYSRVVGYYRPVSRWNPGKREEWGLRRFYSVP